MPRRLATGEAEAFCRDTRRVRGSEMTSYRRELPAKCRGYNADPRGHLPYYLGMWLRLYTPDAFPARRLRKRAIAAIVLVGAVLIGIALILAPVVPY
jgi:hypothetical protein